MAKKFKQQHQHAINHVGYNAETKEWWGGYKRNSQVFLYNITFEDGSNKNLCGRMFTVHTDQDEILSFFDYYENGTFVDWVSRFNKVFDTNYQSIKEVKEHLKEVDGSLSEFMHYYAYHFLPKVLEFRILNHPEFPIIRKKSPMWNK